jgi:hypothetical protein
VVSRECATVFVKLTRILIDRALQSFDAVAAIAPLDRVDELLE